LNVYPSVRTNALVENWGGATVANTFIDASYNQGAVYYASVTSDVSLRLFNLPTTTLGDIYTVTFIFPGLSGYIKTITTPTGYSTLHYAGGSATPSFSSGTYLIQQISFVTSSTNPLAFTNVNNFS
jgi:hypothetical protein